MDHLGGLGACEAAAGVRSFVAEYEARRFVGRAGQLATLSAWVRSGERFLLVVAPAGRGKSALIHRWLRELDEPDVVYLPVSQRFATAQTPRLRRLALNRLRHLGHTGQGDWTDILAAQDKRPLVVVDGLDELVDDGFVEDLRKVAEHRSCRLIVAMRELVDRDAAGWIGALGLDVSAVEVVELEGLNREAITELVPEVPATTLNDIVRIGRGDPLTTLLLAESIENDAVDLAQVSAGLDGVFSLWWQQTSSDQVESSVLAALSRAVGPVSPSLLARCTNLSLEQVGDSLQSLARWLVRNADGDVALAHPRLGDFFGHRMDEATRQMWDQRWRTVTTGVLSRVTEGEAAGVDVRYAASAHRVHLSRTNAPLSDFAALIHPAWLAARERHEGGTAGFMGDLLGVWAEAARKLHESWSEEVCGLLFRLSTLATLLAQSESALSDRARAESVRLGLRSQHAAVASLASNTTSWTHRSAVAALLPVLDERGFDLLLDADGSGWPTAEIAARLLARRLYQEAQDWALRGDNSSQIVFSAARTVELAGSDMPPEVLAALRDAVYDNAVAYQSDALEDDMEVWARAASVLDETRRDELLERARLALDTIGDDELFWDPYYEGRDPRLVLAEAFVEAGRFDQAEALLQRAVDNPYPMAGRPHSPGPEHYAVVARLGFASSGLLAEPDPNDLAIQLAAAQGATDLSSLLGCIARAERRQTRHLHDALGLGLKEVSRAAARRVWQLVDGCIDEAHEDYAAAYPLYDWGLFGVGRGAQWLDPAERERALRRVWHALGRRLPNPVTPWHRTTAMVGLLAALPPGSSSEADSIRTELLARSLDAPTVRPALCDVEGWSAAFTEDQRRQYIDALLRHRSLPKAAHCLRVLAGLGNQVSPSLRQRVLAHVVTLAQDAGTIESLGDFCKDLPAWWRECAPLVIEAYENNKIGPWGMARLLPGAPDEAARIDVARHAWARGIDVVAQMGCASQLLAALPEGEACRLARECIERDHHHHLRLEDLPSDVLAEHLCQLRASAADWMQQAQLLVRANQVAEHPALAGLHDELVEQLLAALPGAPDESSQRPTTAPIWAALYTIVALLDAETLEAITEPVLDRGSSSFVERLGHYRVAEGLTIDHFAQRRPDLSEILRLRLALQASSSSDDLREAFRISPRSINYPWVVEIVASRGLDDELAHLVSCDTDISRRISTLRLLWPHLEASKRAQWLPEILRWCDDERASASSANARLFFFEHLGTGDLRRQWLAELAFQHRTRRFMLLSAYAEPLDLIDRFATELMNVLDWFVAPAAS